MYLSNRCRMMTSPDEQDTLIMGRVRLDAQDSFLIQLIAEISSPRYDFLQPEVHTILQPY